jgi:hypothetical protein
MEEMSNKTLELQGHLVTKEQELLRKRGRGKVEFE